MGGRVATAPTESHRNHLACRPNGKARCIRSHAQPQGQAALRSNYLVRICRLSSPNLSTIYRQLRTYDTPNCALTGCVQPPEQDFCLATKWRPKGSPPTFATIDALCVTTVRRALGYLGRGAYVDHLLTGAPEASRRARSGAALLVSRPATSHARVVTSTPASPTESTSPSSRSSSTQGDASPPTGRRDRSRRH